MANPDIQELQNNNKFELIAQLNHNQIKAFVVHQLSEGGWLVKSYIIYQLLMLVLGVFIITRSIILAFNSHLSSLIYVVIALFFCLSFLIVIHEVLHGIAIKFTGAEKINYGAYFRKFIFYAEADQHVLNKKQFTFIALTPLFVIKSISLIGIILFFQLPVLYFFVFVMCAHSLFCAGDIGLLSIFYKDTKAEIYTFDVKAEKKSYFYKRK